MSFVVNRFNILFTFGFVSLDCETMNSGATVVGTGAATGADTGAATGAATGADTGAATVAATGAGTTTFWTKLCFIFPNFKIGLL